MSLNVMIFEQNYCFLEVSDYQNLDDTFKKIEFPIQCSSKGCDMFQRDHSDMNQTGGYREFCHWKQR